MYILSDPSNKQIHSNHPQTPPMHPDTQTSLIDLKFHFLNDATHNIKYLHFSVPYFSHSRTLRINEALQYAKKKAFLPSNAQIFYADYANKISVFLGSFPFSSQLRIDTDTLINSSIHINYRSVQPSELMEDEDYENLPTSDKKLVKKKQRQIGEALEAVKVWRQLYDTPDQKGRRLYTLEEAAKKVGMAKKTLDDYFNQMKMAHSYNFDFEKYKNHKIGFLRKFVKMAKQGEKSMMSDYIIDNDTDKYWN